MNLAKRIFDQTGYSVLQQAQKFIFSTIGNIIVINALPREHYGAIGLAAGYFVFVLWFSLSPESILAQRYRSIRKNNFSEYISVLFVYNFLSAIVLIALSCIIALYIWGITGSLVVSIIFLAYAITQILLLISGMIQYILKIEFQQKTITKWTTIIKSFELLLLFILLFYPNVYIYLGSIGLIGILEIIFWSKALRKIIPFSFWRPIKKCIPVLRENIISYSLWHHITNNLTKYIYQVDTIFLAFWASLVTVGDYAIAIKIVNYAFILPSILQSSTVLTLTRLQNNQKKDLCVSIFLKYSFLLSIFQLIIFLFVGKWYISLFTQIAINEIYLYALLILIGITILNTVRPLLGYIMSQTNIKDFVLYSIIPSAIFTTCAYSWSSYEYGATGIAAANIVSYSFWSITIIIFTLLKTSYRFSFTLFSPYEKEIWKNIWEKK